MKTKFNQVKRIPAATAHARPRGRRRFRLSALALLSLPALLASAPLCHAQEKPPSLMTVVTEWKYPDSNMSGASLSDGATVNDAGERTIPSILYKAVLTTQDPMSKVIEYYKTKFPETKLPEGAPGTQPDVHSGRSVTFIEDSDGRPVAIHIILVNTDDTSTTLVISRGETESGTHIAWTQYRKLAQ
jgi:hypothetical protein